MEHIYEKVSQSTGYPQEVVKAVGNHIFQEIRNFTHRPATWMLQIQKFATIEFKYFSLRKYVEILKEKNTGENKVSEYSRILELGENHRKQQKENGKQRNKKS